MVYGLSDLPLSVASEARSRGANGLGAKGDQGVALRLNNTPIIFYINVCATFRY